MAYAYNAIDEMMGSNNSGPTNQNIFAPQGTPGNTGADQGSAPQQGQSQVKTSAEGDVSNASSTTNPSSPKVVNDTTSQDAGNRATQAAFAANRGKTQAPTSAFQAVQANLDSANNSLAQKASDYAAQQASSHNYNLDKSVADQAVQKQDVNAKGKIYDLLNRTTAAPVDTFDPGKLDVSDANLLNTNAGIKELVARGQGPKYSPNMAAFDSMLLQADPNFQKQVGGLKAQAGAFSKNVTDTTDKAQADAAAAAQANLTGSQNTIKDYLSNYQQKILADEQAAAAKANAGLPDAIAAQKAKVQSDLLQQAQEKARQSLGSIFGAGRADSQLAGIKEDPSKYINWLSGYNPNQFVNQDQANQYNTINSLLGLGEQSQVAAGDLPSLYTANSNDLYNSLVDKATTARQAADKTDTSSIQAIMDQANKSAQADNARRLGLSNDAQYTKSLSDMAVRLRNSPEFSQYRSIMTDPFANRVIADYQTQNPYAKMGSLDNPNLTANDLLNQQQADKLNSLSKDLGLTSTYAPGQYAAGGPGSLVNQNSFKSALLSALQQYQANAAKTAELGKQPMPTPQTLFANNTPVLPPDSNEKVDMDHRPAPIVLAPGQNNQQKDPWAGILY